MMKNQSVNRIAIAPMLNRREVLSFLSGAAAVSLVGCWREQSASSEPANSSPSIATMPACIVRPEQTEGPYFTDERLNRADIRSDPADGAVKAGIPLQLKFQVSQVSDRACLPLPNAIVDIWHCDAEGIYSDVRDRRFNTIGKKFLRGYQVTDANGMAQFVTIYPGWYPGRAVHIHFKIRTAAASQPGAEFTSQLYFDDALTAKILAQPPYRTSGRRTLNNQDGIYQAGGEQLLLQLAQTATGYSGEFAIGLQQT